MLLNNEWDSKVKGKVKRSPETNEHRNRAFQNLCDAANTVLREKFRAI